mmetsp:Transcript_9819/g.21604  ORF Transcript_9819/g.21604 Transcript_9819/m.21604 type:complete len:430 (+) Transcript_9819:144-1433(+)
MNKQTICLYEKMWQTDFTRSCGGPLLLTLLVLVNLYNVRGLSIRSVGGHPASHADSEIVVPLRRTPIGLVADITVGTPGHPCSVIVDSGSANVLVAGTSLSTSSSTGHYLSKTGSFVDYESAWRFSVAYSSGSISGEAYQDQLCLTSTVCAKGVSLLLGESESSSLANIGLQGVLGLAPSGYLSAGPNFSIMSVLLREGTIPTRVFSVAFGPDGSTGKLVFGGRSQKSKSISWLAADIRQGAWEVTIRDVQIEQQTDQQQQDQQQQQQQQQQQELQQQLPTPLSLGRKRALFDTGCPNLVLPGTFIEAYAKQADLDRYAGRDCEDLIPSLPSLILTFAEISISLSAKYFVEQDPDSGACRLRFSALFEVRADDRIIFGLPLFEAFSVVFDEDQEKIGLLASNQQNHVAGEGDAASAMREMLRKARQGAR